MSRLEELLRELCPDGVEYKKISDVTTVARGKRVVRDQLSQTEGYPVYQNSLTVMGYHTETNFPANTTFVIGAGAAGEIGYAIEDFWAADDCFPIVGNESLLSRYIYHTVMWKKPYLVSKVRKASIPRLSRSFIEDLVIPVPPLEVQSEIVRILDNFTELTAELTARKKQYEFYKYSLITPTDGKEYRVDELCDICRGRVMSKPYIAEHKGDYPVYSSQTENDGELGRIDSYDFEGEYLSWTTDGANAGTVFYRTGKFSVTNVCGLLKCKNNVVIPRYLYYTLAMEAPSYVSRGMGNPKLMSNVMARIKVKIPSVAEQQKVVNILDRFDSLCNDITMGLPAEIEARQKQYEYYRDKLLTFKELA